MKEIKVKLVDKTTLELMEDASKGDYIKLDNLSDVQLDMSYIETEIQQGKEAEYQRLLDKEKKLLESEFLLQNKDELSKKDSEIITLRTKLENDVRAKELELKSEYEKKIAELQSSLNNLKENSKVTLEKELSKVELDAIKEKQELQNQISVQKNEIALLKDFKVKMSTKMVGESLEQHCEIMYNQIGRVAFPNAEFYKDNDARSGSKGDFIYREYDEDGIEVLSIMFEMKNENETTSTKHKNSHFYKELDKDRNEKKCEFAVLVSMLEQDNELYSDIYTVWEYPNMYVVRPQHFINIIGLLRTGAVKSHEYKVELEKAKNASIDITSFENNLNNFKTDFSRNYDLASRKFNSAIDEIDKAIANLQKVRDNLTGSDKNLRIANDKLTDLTIKKISKNNPTITKMLEEKE